MTIPPEFIVRDRRRFGYFQVDNEIIDKHGARLGAYGVAVYNILSRHVRNDDTQQTRLSVRDIAASLGISHDRVRKSLSDLVRTHLIWQDVPERPAPGSISTFTLLDVKPTGRHTSSSSQQLDATRPDNKEEKTKTKNKIPPQHGQPTQKDFDGRDWRNMCAARKKLLSTSGAAVGADVDDKQFFADICLEAGVSITRGKELEARMMQWPEQSLSR